ncbi:unnamed protein product [Rangifer tarandus platyrhynchus]|uniref:Uncharacterized protein n=1 Tax=Rangifer tarandus platyrhynchus TaxID=3082113 RepID=A0AC59YN65_RANTA
MWAPVQPGTTRVAMVELQQPWVQEAVDSMVKCLERENIQKMQGLMFCDKVKDSIDVGSKELQVERRLETCVTKCVDDHVNLIPTLTRKMKESLSSIGK